MDEERQSVIQGLRAFADFLEVHPSVPMTTNVCFDGWVHSKEELANALREVGSARRREVNGFNYLVFRREFSSAVAYEINASKADTCKARVVGVREIPKRIIPARTEEIVEWDCDQSILAAAPREEVGV